MKKLCSYILCICLTFGIAVSSFAYSDINEHHSWAKEAIESLSESNVINGYPDGTYCPENNVSKAELAKMVCLLFGYGNQVQYSDVSEKDWYYDFVSKSGGYFWEEAAFSPNRFATREEVAYAVYSAMPSGALPTDKKISFSDQNEIANTYLAAVKFLNEQGVITGYPDGSFRPKNPVTRAETAVILHRAYQLKNTVPTPEPSPEENTLKTNNYFFLVQKVATVVDENGEIATKVTGYQDGKLQEILLNDNVSYHHSDYVPDSQIKPGNLISFVRDFFGNVIHVSVGVHLSNLPEIYRIEMLYYGDTIRSRQIHYGTVIERYKEKGLELKPIDGTPNKSYSLTETVNVYLWQNGKAKLADLYEINDSTYEPGDKVVVRCFDDEISDIIIIR